MLLAAKSCTWEEEKLVKINQLSSPRGSYYTQVQWLLNPAIISAGCFSLNASQTGSFLLDLLHIFMIKSTVHICFHQMFDPNVSGRSCRQKVSSRAFFHVAPSSCSFSDVLYWVCMTIGRGTKDYKTQTVDVLGASGDSYRIMYVDVAFQEWK